MTRSKEFIGMPGLIILAKELERAAEAFETSRDRVGGALEVVLES